MDTAELVKLYEEIQDRLAPLQTPYEQAVYRYLFRHSWAKSGGPQVTVGVRQIGVNLGQPARWRGKVGDRVPYNQVRRTLNSLTAKQHIRESSRSRQGTCYLVLLPVEILGAAGQVETDVSDPYELDHYNVPERRGSILARDGRRCFYCQQAVDDLSYTIDHIVPVSQQGDHRPRNLITACHACNSQRAGRGVEDFLRDCYRRHLLSQDELQERFSYLEDVRANRKQLPSGT